MPKKTTLFIAGILFFVNIVCWKEVFALQGPQILQVDFLNVGQGDSALIKTPQGHKILIDGGPDSTVLQKLAENMPFWDKTIDLIILSHPEKDHMQGLLDVLQKYNVKYFLWTGVVKNDAENKKLAEILNKIQKPQNNLLADLQKIESTKVIVAEAGEKIKAGDVVINILFPFENLAGKELKNSSNNTAVVNNIVYGKNSFLFVGDIDSAAEKKIVNSEENILADVLKVAHHGSKYSTSDLFLENVRPKIAVIEVGKNSYGHPTSETLQRLEKFGIKMFRTDINGDVKMTSDGNNIKLIK